MSTLLPPGSFTTRTCISDLPLSFDVTKLHEAHRCGALRHPEAPRDRLDEIGPVEHPTALAHERPDPAARHQQARGEVLMVRMSIATAVRVREWEIRAGDPRL